MIGAANLSRGSQWRGLGVRAWQVHRHTRIFYHDGLGWFIGMGLLSDSIIIDVSRAKARRILAAIIHDRCKGYRP